MQKRVIDLTIASICLAVLGIVWLYPDEIRGRSILMWVSFAGLAVFSLLALFGKDGKRMAGGNRKSELPSETGQITEAVLLSEEDTELMTWDLYGKTAAVIGRDVKENQVDIDLGSSPYASMVDIEHAVLNYSCGGWYVEDLGSSNGLKVKKAMDGKVYKLSADTPCKLEQGDCLYIGLNRLLLK